VPVTQTRLSIRELLAELDGYAERIPLDDLVQRISLLDITLDDVRPFVLFGRTTYQRNLMHSGPGYSALILCWRSGHRSPIHDHRGSSCGVKVIHGAATETYFERTPDGYVYATSSRRLVEGQACGSQDDDMHQMSNLERPGQDLVTLHIYSPPLMNMGVYSLLDTAVGEFRDPIVELLDGAGI
jgi:cysteine dioxygenase